MDSKGFLAMLRKQGQPKIVGRETLHTHELGFLRFEFIRIIHRKSVTSRFSLSRFESRDRMDPGSRSDKFVQIGHLNIAYEGFRSLDLSEQ